MFPCPLKHATKHNLGDPPPHPPTPPPWATLVNPQRGRRQRRRLYRSRSSVSPCSHSPCGGAQGDGVGGSVGGAGGGGGDVVRGDASSLTPGRRSGASFSSNSLHRQSFRETAKVVKRKLNNGTIIINKYQILSELGRGSYGSVHLCKDGDTGVVRNGGGVLSLLIMRCKRYFLLRNGVGVVVCVTRAGLVRCVHLLPLVLPVATLLLSLLVM